MIKEITSLSISDEKDYKTVTKQKGKYALILNPKGEIVNKIFLMWENSHVGVPKDFKIFYGTDAEIEAYIKTNNLVNADPEIKLK